MITHVKKVLLPCQEKEKKQSSSFGWTIEQTAQGMEVSELSVSSTVTYSRVLPSESESGFIGQVSLHKQGI